MPFSRSGVRILSFLPEVIADDAASIAHACRQLHTLANMELGTRIVLATDNDAYDLIDIEDALVIFLKPQSDPPHYPDDSIIMRTEAEMTEFLRQWLAEKA